MTRLAVPDSIRGFYAVLDRDDEALCRALLASGARVLQVRIKPATTSGQIARAARMARRLCTEHGAALVVNDRADIALAVGADGVHLGQTDVPLERARKHVGDRLWIGVSTHDLAQVRAAVAGGADYLGFGPVFPTTTKQNPDPVQGVEGLRAAVAAAGGVPVVAIGGITPAHAAEVYGAGASAICAIGAVIGSADVAAAARALMRG
ncbi:MAG: thiamine phosphate synthase [Myxococcales bacterium]|nr:thiamine phosphate synthase [Myxococcales bacterium]